MEFECLICGTECKLRKGKTVPDQLSEWQQHCPKKLDEDGLTWFFNLDLKGYGMIYLHQAHLHQ